MMFKLRPYQEPISKLVFDYFRANPGKHPLVALPTGAGKTVVLADLIHTAVRKWPDTKILVLSHVKEILTQNYASIKEHTGLDVGLHSASLGEREVKDVTVAGIQSVYRNPEAFADYQLIIIDECHLIPPGENSMYRKFFDGLIKPRYFGLTATPFRLGGGYIYGQDNSIFDDLILDMTSREKFNGMIDDGYLCNLKTSVTDLELDTTGIHTVAGDFNDKEMSSKFDVTGITNMAVREIIKAGANYKKWLIFAIDIAHAEHISQELNNHDIPTATVHSKMDSDRDTVIRHYKLGTFRAIVNVNVLTTGFDNPEIDLIALLRPTKSPVIHVQTIGRGLRIAPNKDHCLILDFAGNTERLGPINDIQVRKKRKGKGGEPITKRCPDCDTIHHPTVKICLFCGHVFKFKTLLSAATGKKEVIARREDTWFNVSEVTYNLHQKQNSPDMIRVRYQCGIRYFNEYVCIQHNGYAGHKARHWLRYRGLEAGENPRVSEILPRCHDLNQPVRIKVDTKGKYPNIVDYSFNSV